MKIRLNFVGNTTNSYEFKEQDSLIRMAHCHFLRHPRIASIYHTYYAPLGFLNSFFDLDTLEFLSGREKNLN